MTSELDPDRRLALAYVPAAQRPALEALWRLDVSLGKVLATGREPMISQIRLAWWRESLEKLDHQPAPAEPVLRAVADQLLPLGLSGQSLARMEAGWAALASPHALEGEELGTYARERGGILFHLSAQILCGQHPLVEEAGESWALVDLARHSGEPDSSAAFALARPVPAAPLWPKRLRPLGMLWVLSRRDLARGKAPFEPQGSPGRMWLMIRHRLTGR